MTHISTRRRRPPQLDDELMELFCPWSDYAPKHEHSENCGVMPYKTCRECVTRLCQYPVWQWPRQERRFRRQGTNLPEPLPDEFLRRLAADMADMPHLFAPVVEYLLERAREQANEASE